MLLLRSAHRRAGTSPAMQLVPTGSRGDKSHRVNWPFFSKSDHKDQRLIPGTGPRIKTGLNSWNKWMQLVPQNAVCELFVEKVLASSLFM